MSSIAVPAASASTGESPPQARATALHTRGRTRAPPGNTAWRTAATSPGGASAVATAAIATSRFASIRVIHSLEATQRLVNPDPSPEELAIWRRRPPKEHPLVWTHLSGRRSLVLGATTERVVGMDPDASRAFLDDLLTRATRPDRVYRHEWAVGDLVIWDNTGVLHRALPYDATSARDMHRTTLYGTEAVR